VSWVNEWNWTTDSRIYHLFWTLVPFVNVLNSLRIFTEFFFLTFWFLFHMWLFVKRLMIDFPRHVYLFPPFYFGNPFFGTMIWPILWANVGYVILCQTFQFVSCTVLIRNFIWFGSFWNWRRLDIRISSRYKFLIGNLTSVSYFSSYYYSIQILNRLGVYVCQMHRITLSH
jgi:hypothetical protein